MAEEIDFENGRNSNFEGLVTLTLTFNPAIRHIVLQQSSTSTYIPNFIQIEETFCGWTDVRTYGRTDIFPLYIIRWTFGSRPKNENRNLAAKWPLATKQPLPSLLGLGDRVSSPAGPGRARLPNGFLCSLSWNHASGYRNLSNVLSWNIYVTTGIRNCKTMHVSDYLITSLCHLSYTLIRLCVRLCSKLKWHSMRWWSRSIKQVPTIVKYWSQHSVLENQIFEQSLKAKVAHTWQICITEILHQNQAWHWTWSASGWKTTPSKIIPAIHQRHHHTQCQNHVTIGYGFLFTWYSNYSCIFSRFWDIQYQRMVWLWNTGLGSFKATENGAVQ